MQSTSVRKSCFFMIVFLLLSACGPAAPTVPPPAVTVSPPAAEQAGADFYVNCPAGASYSDDLLQISYDWQLIGGFQAEQVPAAGNVPAHWEFTAVNGSGPCLVNDSSWLRQSSPPKIYLFPAAEYAAADPVAAARIAALQALLDRWPQAPEGEPPLLPALDGSPAFHDGLRLVNFANGSGIRFLTRYPDEAQRVRGDETFYTFQGLTAGGDYYLAAIFPLYAPPEFFMPTPNPLIFIPPPTPLPTFLTPPPTRVYPGPGEEVGEGAISPTPEIPPGPVPSETPRPYPVGEMDPSIPSVVFTPAPTPLWDPESQPSLEALDRLVESINVRLAPPAFESSGLAGLPASCTIAGMQALASRPHKFCFAYPPGFTQEPNNPFLLMGPSRGEGWEQRLARLNIQVEGLAQEDQRSLEERVNEVMGDYSFADPSAGVRQSLTLGGEPAEMIELPPYSPPGALEGFVPPTNRMLFTLHGGRFYTLSLDITPSITLQEATAMVDGTAQIIQIEPSETPSEGEITQSQADFEALYQAILESFTFLP